MRNNRSRFSNDEVQHGCHHVTAETPAPPESMQPPSADDLSLSKSARCFRFRLVLCKYRPERSSWRGEEEQEGNPAEVNAGSGAVRLEGSKGSDYIGISACHCPGCRIISAVSPPPAQLGYFCSLACFCFCSHPLCFISLHSVSFSICSFCFLYGKFCIYFDFVWCRATSAKVWIFLGFIWKTVNYVI